MKNFLQSGWQVERTAPTGGCTAGLPYKIGGVTGVAQNTVLAAGTVVLTTGGVFAFGRATGYDPTLGDAAKFTTTGVAAASGTDLGTVIGKVASGPVHVLVNNNPLGSY